MAHMTIQYSGNLDACLDMTAFCDAVRDAMVNTGLFPLAGIRVRAYPAAHYTIADGTKAFAFADLVCRIGLGRSKDQKAQMVDEIYSDLEDWVKPRLTQVPFALSLEVVEINYPFAEKRLNTIRAALQEDETNV